MKRFLTNSCSHVLIPVLGAVLFSGGICSSASAQQEDKLDAILQQLELLNQRIDRLEARVEQIAPDVAERLQPKLQQPSLPRATPRPNTPVGELQIRGYRDIDRRDGLFEAERKYRQRPVDLLLPVSGF